LPTGANLGKSLAAVNRLSTVLCVFSQFYVTLTIKPAKNGAG